MNTNITTMKENLSKFEAKEIFYYQWTAGDPYTVDAGDGKEYGNLTTIGYTDNPRMLDELGLPIYNICPHN